MNTDKLYAEALANEYSPKDTSKVLALKKLDRKAKLPSDSYFTSESMIDVAEIGIAELSELYLITPKYLYPYLQYVKDHRRLFKTVIKKTDVLNSENSFRLMFAKVFSPIMDRYNIPENRKLYLLAFYINGIIGLIDNWLDNDCREPIEVIAAIITECIKTP